MFWQFNFKINNGREPPIKVSHVPDNAIPFLGIVYNFYAVDKAWSLFERFRTDSVL